MADEQDNPGDLRIPIRVTIPWNGKMTRGGQLWPRDRQGRDWPSSRWGDPARPLDEYPPGVPAPGTGPRPLTIETAARSYLAALDVEKAAYGARSIPTLTVTPNASETRREALADRVARLGPVMLIVGGTFVATASAPEILSLLTITAATAAAIVAAGVAIRWLREKRWFPDARMAAAFLRHLLGLPEHEALIPPEQVPLLPPPPPPPVTEDKPGLVPAAPSPAQPGFTPAPPIPLVPPAPEPHAPIGRVMESRNRGLRGGARTYSGRARRAARRVDPGVVQHLQDNEWEAHHLVSIAAIKAVPDLHKGAVRAGWRTDGDGNVAAVPSSAAAQRKLQAAGVDRPLHDNGHPNWNAYVKQALKAIKRRVNRIRFNSTESRDAFIRREFNRLETVLRKRMIRFNRITSTGDGDNVKSV